jgi:hypothetical protein
MRLLLRRSVRENRLLLNRKEYHLWARFELTEQERDLIRRYDIDEGYLTIEGSREEMRRAMRFAILPTIVAMTFLGPQFSFFISIPLWFIVFGGITWLIYEQIREAIKVQDILNGRDFKNRSVMFHIRRERRLLGYAVAFKTMLEKLEMWAGTEVVELGDEHELALRMVTDTYAPA